MKNVQWIKITTDMFDNRKIRHLRKLPEGNNIVLIWVMLLTMAGRCNADGRIYLTENIPYTPKMLADELDFEENTVRLALEALERLNMVVNIDGEIAIAGWEEYQNVEGMARAREQAKIRMRNYRERKRLAEGNPETENDGNGRCYTDVTQRYTDVTHQNKNKKENKSKKEDINTIPPRNNDTEKGNDRTYRAGAEEEIDFEGVSENGTDFERAGRACEAESRGTEASAGRGNGDPQNGVPGNKPLDWRDLSKDRLH